MGVRGQIPKRTSQRLGHLTKAQKAESTVIKTDGAVEIPAASESWHDLAKDWYRSLSESAQKSLMEPSDWSAARFLANEMTRMLAGEPNAAMLGKVWAAMGDLMTTEGARRRLKVEVDRRSATALAPVAQLHDYRAL